MRPNPDIIPDPEDPDRYCVSRSHTYTTKGNYRYHSKFVHKMTNLPHKRDYRMRSQYKRHMKEVHKGGKNMDPIIGKTRIDPNIEPDINYPYFFCRSCILTLSSKSKFIYHIRNIHGRELNFSHF